MTDAQTPTFAASTEADSQLTPFPFTLEGVYAPGRKGPGGETTWREQMHLSPVAPAAAAAAWQGAFIHVDGQEVLNPASVLEFLYGVLVPESSSRLRQMINEGDRLVKLEVLGEVFDWASQKLMGSRPTPPPSS